MDIAYTIQSVLAGVKSLEAEMTIAPRLNSELGKWVTAAEVVGKSWSGSWFTLHTDFYFQDFKEPHPTQRFNSEWGLVYQVPEGWHARTEPEVVTEIESHHSGDTLEELLEQVQPLKAAGEDFQETILASLSPIVEQEGFAKEQEILASIEKLKLNVNSASIERNKMPRGQVMSRDSAAINSGFRAPYHIQLEAKAQAGLVSLGAIETLIKLTKRLLAQMETKLTMRCGSPKALNAVKLLEPLLYRFHKVARQLLVRHAHRNTLEITDEYDVQDLLHSLLRIHFDDIREEEWTPSYAGKSSRVDFLLKDQSIVIEVKKTRPGLDDKVLGDELIIDVARYKSHPDCKTLICFIYDPEGRIKNPKGLVKDLEKMSDSALAVQVVINPLD